MCRFAIMSPALDPLRQLDLLLGGQQLDATDRAQVQPQRVEARLDGQVELRLLRRLRLTVPFASLYAVSPSRRDHVHPVLDQVAVQVLDLLLGHLDLLERPRDLLEGQVAALAPLRDQRPQLVEVGERRLAVEAVAASPATPSSSLPPSDRS